MDGGIFVRFLKKSARTSGTATRFHSPAILTGRWGIRPFPAVISFKKGYKV